MTPAEIIQAIYADHPVLIYGHRGAKAYAPMNTIPAFELAAQQGAHGIELDVQLSADGEPVIIHDESVDGTTDGTGAVADLSLAELRRLDAGAWFDERFAGTRIPTLDEIFEAVGRRLIINVEIKHLARESNGIEEVVAKTIREHGMTERVIVSSFNPYILVSFRQFAPEIPVGFLQAPDFTTPEMRSVMAEIEYEAEHLHYSMVGDAELPTETIVNVWTLNDPEQAKQQVRQGVRGIITDTPDVMVEALL